MQSLRIDNFGAFLSAQFRFIDKTEQVTGAGAAVDPAGNRSGNFETLGERDLFCHRCFERPVDPLDGGIQPALIEQMDRFEIPLQPFGNQVAVVASVSLFEQLVGFGKFTQIGFLQRPVDQIFLGVDILPLHSGCPLLQCFKKSCGLGIIAAEVATIAFCQRLVGFERCGLHAGKGKWVFDRCRGDVNFAFGDRVLQNRLERQQGSAVIGGQAFRDIGNAVLLADNLRIGDRFCGEMACRVTKAAE